MDAFRRATKLPLTIMLADDPEFIFSHGSPNQNEFCERLNSLHGPCKDCISTQQILIGDHDHRTRTCTCFAGLQETMVPVKQGRQIIAFLKTGQVRLEESAGENGEWSVKDKIRGLGYSEEEEGSLSEAFDRSPKMNRETYDSMMVLLNVISLQLSEFLNRLLLEDKPNEGSVIREVKEFIMDNIDEKISLSEVAEKAGVSVYYFCKLFKKSTGLTFTEYVNRQRVELAKGELVRTNHTVTHIAYAVGFHSLSQFNRCFNKYTGESPSNYRVQKRQVIDEFLIDC